LAQAKTLPSWVAAEADSEKADDRDKGKQRADRKSLPAKAHTNRKGRARRSWSKGGFLACPSARRRAHPREDHAVFGAMDQLDPFEGAAASQCDSPTTVRAQEANHHPSARTPVWRRAHGSHGLSTRCPSLRAAYQKQRSADGASLHR